MNPRHSPCKGDALPAELSARKLRKMRSSYLEEERASVNGEKGENADFAGKTFPGGGIPAENLSELRADAGRTCFQDGGCGKYKKRKRGRSFPMGTEPLRFPYLLRYAGPACSDKRMGMPLRAGISEERGLRTSPEVPNSPHEQVVPDILESSESGFSV